MSENFDLIVIGALFGELEYINAMTDVTGFGLLGHLIEMCEAADISAEIKKDKIPVMPNIQSYLDQNAIPGGTKRNQNLKISVWKQV